MLDMVALVAPPRQDRTFSTLPVDDPAMACQSSLKDIFAIRKPLMESTDSDLKRKAAAKDLRKQAILGAQEAAKRQCIEGGVIMQEQQPPPLLAAQQDGSSAPIDFQGFYKNLRQEKQQEPAGSGMVEQQQQQHPLPSNLFIGSGRSHQQPHQHSSQGGLGGILPRRQQQQQQCQDSATTSLDQLLAQHDLGSKQYPHEGELKHMASLDRILGGDASRDGFIRQQHAGQGSQSCNRSNTSAAAAAAPREQQPGWHLTGLSEVPWDWSVKGSIRLASSAPFSLLDEQQQQGLDSMCQAVAAVAAAASAPGDVATGSTVQECLQQALLQWQHPTAPLAPALMSHSLLGANSSTLTAAAGGAGGPAAMAAAAAGDRHRHDPVAQMLHERAELWREAFRGAYLGLRHGRCPVLYICGEAFKQSFTAILCAPGVLGPTNSSCSIFTAVLSRSNRQLRAHLAAYGCKGLVTGQLEQPAAAAAVGPCEQLDTVISQRQQSSVQQPAGAFDGQPGSQMLLLGVNNVHGLYAALLALPWCEAGQPDAPLLSAPVPFLHAQLCPLRLVALPDTLLEQQQQQTGVLEGAQPLHYMELRSAGGLMPWCTHRLLALVHHTQGTAGFQAFFGTDHSGSSLNVVPEHWAAAAVAAGVSSTCSSSPCKLKAGSRAQQQQQRQPSKKHLCCHGFSETEVSSWEEGAMLLHGRVLRQLQVEEGRLAAKLV